MNQLIVDIKKKGFPIGAGSQELTVIKNLSFELSNAEFVCLIGPSGCGKTTLLNTIAGLDDNFDGTININSGHHFVPPSYVFQSPRLLPWRTVLENIQLAIGGNNSLSLITNTLQQLGLSDHLHSYPNHLSLGMQRRVSLARAFCTPSNLLLMDEPFVSLDQAIARKARKLLLSLWREQPRNILFVTHDLDEAYALADRILFLSNAPTRIIDDIKITLPRAERSENQVSAFKEQLRTNHPTLQAFL